MSVQLDKPKAGFGTAPVFFTAISTILGAVMFLRFGYAVGNVSFWGALGIIIIGHLVTIPTAMALAEIATNQKVEGGGEYFIISRSFGLNIGAAIGIALFLSQAISVAFYIIAFAEAFDPLITMVKASYGIDLSNKLIFSIPAMLGLTTLILTKGADLGMSILYVVVGILFLSLILFFAGSTDYSTYTDTSFLSKTVSDPDRFFYVFAICFPAFTGMTAGVGLSGDLKNPKKSIPIGTLAATISGMVVYVFIAWKLSMNASPSQLDENQLVMSNIALWGPIIPIGLACATLSSAMGSIFVAPRTLQALASDRMFPATRVNAWLSLGKKGSNEPFNASLVVIIIAFAFILAGNVNFVAELISMFFMVTYGSICLISFLQHWAADPSYRPSFRSRWYISFIGAFACIILMFQMNAAYAISAVCFMTGLYLFISYYNKDKKGMAAIFQGAIFQLSRQLQVFLQKSHKVESSVKESWRPSIVCISKDSLNRFAVFNMLSWLSHRYGFGTYIHFIEGYYSNTTKIESQQVLETLIKRAEVSHSNVYIDTLISPSYTSAIAQIIQLPGISGKENNMLLVEAEKSDPEALKDIIENYPLTSTAEFDVCILLSTQKGFGYKSEIHIWITDNDYANGNLMILLGYIMLGHPDWHKATIRLFALFPEDELEEQKSHLLELIKTGRLSISNHNVILIPKKNDVDSKTIVNNNSKEADLTIVGFNGFKIKHNEEGSQMFQGYDNLGNILFVNTTREKEIN